MRFTLILALLLFASCEQTETVEGKIKQVEKSFAGYQATILESDGEEAIKWVDQNTLDYYKEILEISRSADSATVQQLDLLDKWTVLTVRHRIPREQLLSMDAESFFIYAVNEEFVGKKSMRDIEIGEIEVDGNTARARILTEGPFEPMYFDFYKEDKKWKIDITSLYPASQTELEKARERMDKDEDEFILQVLKMMTGKEPDPNIWHPITSR